MDDATNLLGAIPISQADILVTDFPTFHGNRDNNPRVHTNRDDLNAYQEIITDFDVDLGYTMKASTQGNGLGMTLSESNYDAAGVAYGTKVMAYDNLGRMITLTDPDADWDQTLTITSRTGETFPKTNMTWQISYDDLGRQVRVRYPDTRSLSDSKTISYDDANNTITTRDPEGRVTVQHMDWAGQLTKLVAEGNEYTSEDQYRTYQYSYDPAGQKRIFTDPFLETTGYDYNEMGLLIVQNYGPSGSDLMSYDLRGLLLEKSDRKGNRIVNNYDKAGRLIDSSSYTPSNILEETTRIAYDKRGLSWRIEGTNLTEYYEYGVKGEVLALHRYLKDDTLRDESNAVLAQVNGAYSYSYTYNDGGMITSMTNPDGSVTNYNYRDGLGFLNAIKDGQDLFAGNFVYNKSGVVISMDWANGVNQTWEFDNRNRIKESTISRPGSVLELMEYELNGVGDITRISDHEYDYNGFGEITWAKILRPGFESQEGTVEAGFGAWDETLPEQTYAGTSGTPTYDPPADLDADGRVSGTDHMDGYLNDAQGAYDEETFTYDPSGNRTSLIQNGTEYRYELGERNRLEKIYKVVEGSETLVISYEYDANGNTSKMTEHLPSGAVDTIYSYDTLNRLIQSVGPHGTATYAYDNANNRFYKSNAEGEKTLYLRHGQIAVAMDLEWGKVNDAGQNEQAVNRYMLSGDLLAGRITNKTLDGIPQPPETSYYHLDHLNSTKLVTDEAGEVTVRYTYRAFGTQLKRINEAGEETGDEGKYSYGGKELDYETELYYFNARYYDATIGRFINVDPIQDGTNWYIYTANNSLNRIDPTGLHFEILNGGSPDGEVPGIMDELVEAYRNHPLHDVYGYPGHETYDHDGFFSDTVSRENVDKLATKFGDFKKDGIYGWSMGGETAAQYLLETEKDDFGLVVIDGARLLTPDQIREIATKTDQLIIIYHLQDEMGGEWYKPGSLFGPRNYETLPEDDFNEFTSLEEELDNLTIIAHDSNHTVVPEIIFGDQEESEEEN
jgi:RHS repeat-associated protein